MTDPVSVSVSMGTLLFLGLGALAVYGITKANAIKEKMEIHKVIDDKSREAYQMSKLKQMDKVVDKLEAKNGAIRA